MLSWTRVDEEEDDSTEDEWLECKWGGDYYIERSRRRTLTVDNGERVLESASNLENDHAVQKMEFD